MRHAALTSDQQLYHSIHARGENVEDVLREADSEGSAVNESSRKLHDSDLPTSNGLDQVMDEDLEDGEVPSENSRVRSQAATDAVGPQGPEVFVNKLHHLDHAHAHEQASSSTQPPSEPQISHDAGTNGRGPLNTPLDHMLRRGKDLLMPPDLKSLPGRKACLHNH